MFTCLCFTYSVLHSISSVKGGTIFLDYGLGTQKGREGNFQRGGDLGRNYAPGTAIAVIWLEAKNKTQSKIPYQMQLPQGHETLI